MPEPSAAIVRILAEAYRSIGGNRAAAVSEPRLAEVTRIIPIYAEGMKVRPVEVISTEVCGMVITEETATMAVRQRLRRRPLETTAPTPMPTISDQYRSLGTVLQTVALRRHR